jgi:hypothetical protein
MKISHPHFAGFTVKPVSRNQAESVNSRSEASSRSLHSNQSQVEAAQALLMLSLSNPPYQVSISDFSDISSQFLKSIFLDINSQILPSDLTDLNSQSSISDISETPSQFSISDIFEPPIHASISDISESDISETPSHASISNISETPSQFSISDISETPSQFSISDVSYIGENYWEHFETQSEQLNPGRTNAFAQIRQPVSQAAASGNPFHHKSVARTLPPTKGDQQSDTLEISDSGERQPFKKRKRSSQDD